MKGEVEEVTMKREVKGEMGTRELCKEKGASEPTIV